jgi:hypothetical protein
MKFNIGIFILVPLLAGACTTKPKLTEREKLDMLKVGMTLEEVMKIYELEDTVGRTSIVGMCGYLMDTVTLEPIIGPNGVVPLISVEFDSNTTYMFSNNRLQFVPTMTGEELRKDSVLGPLFYP